MVFAGLPFLFFYLVITLFLYKISPLKIRNLVLFIASLIFYGWGEPVYIYVMFLSVLVDYIHGMLVERWRKDDRKARAAVASSVFFNLLILFVFKYYDFFASSINCILNTDLPVLNLKMPIGISFYTFQTMSYTIDVYRKDAPVQKNIITFGTFVTLFPQLIAGPVIQYKSVADQLKSRKETLPQFSRGVQRFCAGLAKKVLLANSAGELWDVFLNAEVQNLTFLGSWLGLIAFGFQIYFDFSGYSDMAIGLGRMFGFEFIENFNYPYISKSVGEFWKRWHISLTNWFREYLYFSLGGNRVSRAKWIRNIIIVWLLTGFWHGAGWNFILWGAYYAFFMLFERLFFEKHLRKMPIWFSHMYTLTVVFAGWGLFAIEDINHIGGYFFALFGGRTFADDFTLYYLTAYLPVLIVMAFAATPIIKKIYTENIPANFQYVLTPVFTAAALTLSTAYLVDAGYNPFLYFRF